MHHQRANLNNSALQFS